MEPNKCDELRWVYIKDLPVNTIGYIRAAIQNYQPGVAFSLFGW